MKVRFLVMSSMVIMTLLSLVSYVATRAFFTDTAVSASNTFATATSFGVSPTITPSPTPGALQNLIITEVSSDGLAGTEWVEVYNTTGGNINLENWVISDGNSSDTILGERNLASHKHAVIVPSGSTVVVPATALKIELNNGTIGSGLNDDGDRLIIRDDLGILIDTLSWGTDKTYNDLPKPTDTQSLQRDPHATILTAYLNTWKLASPSVGLRNN